MFGSFKRCAALGVVAGVLGAAGTAIAAGPALAYHINYSQTGASVPVGTTYTATAGSSGFSFVNSSGGVIFNCPTSTLNGKTTTIFGGTSGSPSGGLSVLGGSFGSNNTCVNKSTGVKLTSVVGSFSTPWQITPTGGGPSPSTPFTVTVANVYITITCGFDAQTLRGTLGAGVAEMNFTSGSNITLTNAQSITNQPSLQVGTGCGLAGPYGLTGTYTLKTVGGSAVSSTNNLWLFQN